MKLLEHGASPNLPAAVIVHGTLPQQRVLSATLEKLPEIAARAGLESPALLVVGDVVALQSSLAWFGDSAPVDESRSA
jgi:uroporphyrin-III C-methyltransferase/precorrin-2 dehydrogenase/sirohydrochlorin ferrochelatase